MNNTISQSALLLFSGGQDSAICLFWALNRYATVHTVGFDYGQQHTVEMQCRKSMLQGIAALNTQWGARLGTDTVLDLGIMNQLASSSLVPGSQDSARPNTTNSEIPDSFVPGRNLIFITLSAALAYKLGSSQLVCGVCETDFSGYPDCRDDTIKALQVAINLGMATRMVMHTPLMWLTKAQSWQLAEQEGKTQGGDTQAGEQLVDFIRTQSHTCYQGERSALHPWGYGCGHCPACVLRRKGWEEYQQLKSV